MSPCGRASVGVDTVGVGKFVAAFLLVRLLGLLLLNDIFDARVLYPFHDYVDRPPPQPPTENIFSTR